jgi:hypothetical protein
MTIFSDKTFVNPGVYWSLRHRDISNQQVVF